MSLLPTQAVLIAGAIRRQADALHLDASWPSRCCDVRGGCELRPKLLYAIMQQVDELGSIGVLPRRLLVREQDLFMARAILRDNALTVSSDP